MLGSPLPYLPIQALTSAGLWEEIWEAKQEPEEFWPATYEVKMPGAVVTVVQHDRLCDLEMTFTTGGGVAQARVAITTIRANFGIRTFFLCPCCGKRRMAIIAYKSRMYCGARFLDAGQIGTKSLRRALIFEAVDAAKTLPPRAQKISAGIASDVKRMPAKRRRRNADASPREVPHEMSTEAGWNQGFGAFQHGAYINYIRYEVAEAAEFDLRRAIAVPDTIGLTVEYPALEMGLLLRKTLLKPGEVYAHTLRWTTADVNKGHVLLIVDNRGREPFVAIAHQPFSRAEYDWQYLPITQHANGRYHFVCPVQRTDCNVLYLRNGSFASRGAQRLIHPSQRAAGRKARAGA